MKIKLNSVMVDNQDKALAFYTKVLGFIKKTDVPVGKFRWLTVVSPDEPDGTELVLEPNENPVAKTFQEALFKQGIPLTALAVEDIQKEYERMKELGVVFTMPPTLMGPVTQAVFEDTCGNLIQIYQASSATSPSLSQTNKVAAVIFLQMVVAGDIRAAYDRYVAPEFTSHNPYFGPSAAELMAGMEENHGKYPQKVFEIKRVIGDGDLVAVHSHVRMQAADRGVVVVHLFRFKGDKIVELWDVGQAVPETSVNIVGMF